MTLKKIAEKAGVSTASVSNVINGNFNKVSEETRQKIEKIIEETNYKPNAVARTLATQESRIISLVIPYISEDDTFNVNPYYSYLIAEVEKYVRKQKYQLMIRCVHECRDILPLLSSWNIDGAFFTGIFQPEIDDIRSCLKSPVVFLDAYPSKEGAVNVGIHDYRGGYLAAQHLISCGHSRIAFAGPKMGKEGVIWERFCGFRDACREHGIPIGKEDVFEVNTVVRSSLAVGQDIAFSPKKFTAVAVMSDVSAYGIVEGLHQCGLHVPDDISVIGFDNLPMGGLMVPKLTTISQNIEKKVQKAGEYLFQMIREKRELSLNEKLPVELIERESVRSIRGGSIQDKAVSGMV